MKTTRQILRFVLSLAFAMLAGAMILSTVDGVYGTNLVRFTPVIPMIKIAAQFVPSNMIPRGLAMDAAIVQMFTKDMEDNIYPKNEFYKQSKDDTSMIVNINGALYVVRGVAGGPPNIEIDREIYPKPIVKRIDDSNQYRLQHLSPDAIHITDFEQFQVNYDKRASVVQNFTDSLNKETAEIIANIWLPDGTDNIVRSTGTDTRQASAPSASGTRKRIIKEDFINVLERFNRMDVPVDGRFCVIPAEFMSDLLLIPDFVDASKIGSSKLVEGSIGHLLGFNIFMRSSVGVYDNSGTPVKKDRKAAGAATDNLAALFWYKNWVHRAEGKVKMSFNENDPAYDGSIISAQSWVGGQARKDKKGVIALVETNA